MSDSRKPGEWDCSDLGCYIDQLPLKEEGAKPGEAVAEPSREPCGACRGDGWLWDVNIKVPCDLCHPVLYATHHEMHARINTQVEARRKAEKEASDLREERDRLLVENRVLKEPS